MDTWSHLLPNLYKIEPFALLKPHILEVSLYVLKDIINNRKNSIGNRAFIHFIYLFSRLIFVSLPLYLCTKHKSIFVQ